MTEKMRLYEEEKKQIIKQGLEPKAYEQAIAELIAKLKI